MVATAEGVVGVDTDIERIKSILTARPTPKWFEEAKLGIFVNWGLFSVPGWAPKSAPLPELLRSNYNEAQKLTPRAEWYWNGMRIEGSPTWRYHQDVWKGRPYEDFREPFAATVERWDPAVWAQLFHDAGARYVVLTAKHHDGYLLWPSQFPNPKREGWQASRDVVGELAAACRQLGMHFGIYYSGGLDWTFDDEPIHGGQDVFAHVPAEPEYAHYIVRHYRELIERYSPSVLWNDVGFPDVPELFPLLYFYTTHVTDGAINDRFIPVAPWLHWLRRGPVRKVAGIFGRLRGNGDGRTPSQPQPMIGDFRTIDDNLPKTQSAGKWEIARGMGNSHAWNRAETEGDLIGTDALVHLLADVTARNGNLLLEIGATDEGVFPEVQTARLRALGTWLKTNAEAVYGTRPWWSRAEGTSTDGLAMRFTAKSGMLYAILLGTPQNDSVTIENMPPLKSAKIELLGHGLLDAKTDADGDLTISWPRQLAKQPAYSVKIVLDEEAET
jgi:alpha-L-fucosidase